MIKEIQFQRSKQMMFAMNEQYQVIGQWPCKDDFVPGYNATGETAEVTNGAYGPAYGNFYITTHDPRARDVHGGGSGLPDPYADYQGWIPTYGCLRMQNADGVELSKMIIEGGNNVVLTVIK